MAPGELVLTIIYFSRWCRTNHHRERRGALIAKVDIKCAFRIVPEDCWLLGMRWEGKLFIDTVLPDATEWVVRQEGLNSVFHYRDNFLIMSNPVSPDCDVQLWTPLYLIVCPINWTTGWMHFWNGRSQVKFVIMCTYTVTTAFAHILGAPKQRNRATNMAVVKELLPLVSWSRPIGLYMCWAIMYVLSLSTWSQWWRISLIQSLLVRYKKWLRRLSGVG